MRVDHSAVLTDDSPVLARLLLAATVACLGAVAVEYAFGVVPAGWRATWGWLYNVTQALAASACLLRAVHVGGHERRAWTALSAGLFGFAAADVYYNLTLASMESPPFPSLADAGYLSIYPASFTALVLLLRARAGRVASTLWLDGLIGAVSVAALGAALVFDVVATTDGPLPTVATNLAYPLGDLMMFAFVVAVITVTGWRPGRTWVLVAIGFAVFAVADAIYLVQTARGTYDQGTLLDVTWPTAYTLIAFAAWQAPCRLDARRLRGGAMLVLPAALALLSLGMLMLDHYHRMNALAVWLASASLGGVVVRFAVTFRENVRMLRASEREATTDPLTGLGNRRALLQDLDAAAADGGEAVLALFDLDGFKAYNDAFGHPAGDALLERLGRNVAAAVEGRGAAYRMGGDEFCVLGRVGPEEEATAFVEAAAAALVERGERFGIGCSYGMVQISAESAHPADALRLADQRMYANKRGGRPTSEEAVHQVLLRVVGEHDGALRHHLDDVARLAEQVGRRLGLAGEALADLRRAAALHDIGKVAIPDAILHAPRALTDEEWRYMRQHTVIGARIIGAAPGMARVAEIVRSSHERVDGTGYPDGLAGDDIPLEARVVAVCDSYHAMTTTRSYRGARTAEEAAAELERCAGTQFDPPVVEAFVAVLEAGEQHRAGGGAGAGARGRAPPPPPPRRRPSASRRTSAPEEQGARGLGCGGHTRRILA